MSLTVTDLFCGGGGSSTGMVNVPGVRIRMAANHWKLAVDVHNSNHPDADHAAVDLHLEDPSYFPRTDILWASPECTKWSQANGSKPLPTIEEGLFEDPLSDEASQRSRLLMFDVLRFAEHHRYRAMVVENVVDIATQPRYRLAWQVWQQELLKLGYHYQVVSLNSMHAQALGLPAPQSRDRLYIVCWRDGDRAPDVERMMRPRAWCPRCDEIVEARQAWKPGRTVGRYRQQYVYLCASCGTTVEPGWLPAAAAIDWTLPGKRIGDRDKPLAEKTRARIAAGIARYWHPFHLEAGGHTYDAADPKHPAHGRPDAYYRAWSTYDVLKTLHTIESKALAIPVEGRDGTHARPMGLPLRTQTTRLETAMVVPSGGTWNDDARPAGEPHRAFTTRESYALAMPLHVSLMGSGPAHVTNAARPVDRELRTLTAEGNNDYLLAPYYGSSESAKPVDEPVGTLTTRDRYALVMRHNSSRGDGAEMTTPAWEVLRTLTTRGHQSLVTPGDVEAAKAQVDDCLFRMLEPHEVAAGMAFPADYKWSGTRRERVRLAGNAVTPPAARDLIAAVAEALS
ncbi:MAG TPA: DNA cytosine methyltransferase [Mycobacteriales bacterium]|nr:DNA cytosine methyltransferase [Mycobacteriales bacterium]